MLPFLKDKNQRASQTGVIVKTRPSDHPEAQDIDHTDPEAILEACAQDLISAVHARDIKKTAQILKDTFELLDAMPHVEGQHLESEEI